MIYRRSKLDIFIDVLIVFYENECLRMDVLIRKANLCNGYDKEIIDLLLVEGIIYLYNNNFLTLTNYGSLVVSNIVPGVKKAKELYAKVINNE